MFRQELNQFAAEVAMNQFQVDSASLKIEAYVNPGDVTEGLSGLPLFFVRHPEKRLLFVIKAFPKDSLSVFQELMQGCHFIAQFSLKESKLAMPIAHSRYVKEGVDIVLLALEAARGHTLNTYFKEAQEKPDILLASIRKAASALAELNLLHLKEQGEIGLYFWARDQHWFREFLNILDRFSFDKRQVEKKFKSLFAEMEKHPSAVGFIHSDAHPGNLFYEPEQDILTITDLDRLHHSILPGNIPGGPIAYEYIFSLISMEIAAKLHGLKDARKIVDQFSNGYRHKLGSAFPHEAALRYYRCLFWMRKGYLIATAESGLSPTMKQQLEIMQGMARESLKKDLDLE